MRYLVAALAVGFAMPALSQEMVFRAPGGDVIRIQNAPCTLRLPEGFQHATALVDGKPYAGCWRLLPDGRVHLVYEDGDQGLIPAHLMKLEPGV